MIGEKKFRRRLAAVLAADVAGYSQLMGDHEIGTVAAVHAQIKGKVAASFTDVGELILKNMAAPVRAWRWGGVGMQVQASTSAASAVAGPEGGSIHLQGSTRAGDGHLGPGGNIDIAAGSGGPGAKGGDVKIDGSATIRAGDGGAVGKGGDVRIRAGDGGRARQ